MSTMKSGSNEGLDPRPRVCVCRIKEDRKHAKKLVRLLRKGFGFQVIEHECARKDGGVSDEVCAQISRANVFMPMFSDNVEHSASLRRATDYAMECQVPVVVITTGAVPEEIAARSHVVTVNGKFSNIEKRLSAVDFGELLSRERRVDRPSLENHEPKTVLSEHREQHEHAPTVRVVAIVHRSHLGDDGILLIRRRVAPFQGKWGLPEVDIERYEASQHAAIRAVKEQTGLDFEASFLTYVDEILPRCGKHSVIVGFVGAGVGEADVDQSKVVETAWQSVLEALALDLVPTHRELLQAFADGV